jgi:phasin
MAEATLKAKAKSTATPFTPKFPSATDPFKFEMPKFEMPNVEIPAPYRELAEKSIEQAKQGYEKLKAAAEEASDVLEATFATATKGASDYGLALIEAYRANTNANFDFARDLLTVKSLSEVIELSSAHTRKQFEAVTAQTKELTALAQKVTSETAEPVKSGFTKAFKAVA